MKSPPQRTRPARPRPLHRMVQGWRREVAAPRPAVAILPAFAWLGLLTGLLELGLSLLWRSFHDESPGFFRSNRHVVWIIPVVNLAVFVIAGIAVGIAARIVPRLAARLAWFVPCLLAALTLLLTIRGLHIAAAALLAAGFAYHAGAWARRHAQPSRPWMRRGFPALALCNLVLVGASWGRERVAELRASAGVSPAAPGRPNVLFIVLDTVRADHLSVYGYPRPTSPVLADLAGRGVCFQQARSPAPWTLPSHASMFTGLWPHELSAGLKGPLDGREPTLAEALRERGYQTAGFVANTTYCSAESGLARGFVHYEDHILTIRGVLRATALGYRVIDPLLGMMQDLASAVGLGATLGRDHGKAFKDAATINRDLLAWLPSQPDRPFFAFLNYFDAHHPYVLPQGVDRHFGVRPESRADNLLLHRWWSLDKRKLRPRELALARDAYDDCLAYLDEQLGRLFDELDRRGLLANTLVVITADHGEHLGEHGLFGHASSLYAPEIHVPLLIAGPRGIPRGLRVADPVSPRDLPATILGLVDPESKPGFPGASLARFWESPGSAGRRVERPVLSEVEGPAKGPANGGRSPVFRGAMTSLATVEAVYIRDAAGREELYDLANDPGETQNLAETPGAGARLQRYRDALRHMIRP